MPWDYCALFCHGKAGNATVSGIFAPHPVVCIPVPALNSSFVIFTHPGGLLMNFPAFFPGLFSSFCILERVFYASPGHALQSGQNPAVSGRYICEYIPINSANGQDAAIFIDVISVFLIDKVQ